MRTGRRSVSAVVSVSDVDPTLESYAQRGAWWRNPSVPVMRQFSPVTSITGMSAAPVPLSYTTADNAEWPYGELTEMRLQLLQIIRLPQTPNRWLT